jgi:hypothetical protein
MPRTRRSAASARQKLTGIMISTRETGHISRAHRHAERSTPMHHQCTTLPRSTAVSGSRCGTEQLRSHPCRQSGRVPRRSTPTPVLVLPRWTAVTTLLPIEELLQLLRKKYEGKRAASSSSSSSSAAAGLPSDIMMAGYVLEVTGCLESVTKLICANIMPAKIGFFARNQWLIKHALKRDEVRAEFSAQSAKLDSALHRLGVGAVIAGLPSVDACSGAITRSDLQEFQQQYAEEIQADAAQQSKAARDALEKDRQQLMQKLDEAAILHERLLHLAQEQSTRDAQTQRTVEQLYVL